MSNKFYILKRCSVLKSNTNSKKVGLRYQLPERSNLEQDRFVLAHGVRCRWLMLFTSPWTKKQRDYDQVLRNFPDSGVAGKKLRGFKNAASWAVPPA